MAEKAEVSRARGRARGRGAPLSPTLSLANLSITPPTTNVSDVSSFDISFASTTTLARGTPTPSVVGDDESIRGAYGNSSGPGPLALGQRSGRRFRDEDDYTPYMSRPETCVDKRGKNGQTIFCRTNFAMVSRSQDAMVYQYHVSFLPPVEARRTQDELVSQHSATLGGYLFTGSTLYTTVNMGEHCELPSRVSSSLMAVKLVVKRTAELPPTNPQILTIYNICNRKAFSKSGFIQVGRNYFDPTNSITIPNYKLELWRGFNSAIRSHEESLLMRFDLIFKLLRMDSVLQTLYALFDTTQSQAAADPGLFQRQATQMLVGTSVLTRYNNKMYRIDEIMWDMRSTDTFERSDGSRISYAQYYRDVYGLEVTDSQQPLMLSRAKKRGTPKPGQEGPKPMDVYLLPEFCIMTGLDDTMRRNRPLMRAMAEKTRAQPTVRMQSASNHLARLRDNPETNNLYGQWGLTLAEELLRIPARVLGRQKISMGGREVRRQQEADWNSSLKGHSLNNPIAMDRWFLVFEQVNAALAEEFLQSAELIARGVGMSVSQPQRLVVGTGRLNIWVDQLREAVEETSQAGKPPKMVVTVVPNDNKDRYDAIKKLTCLELGVPNQVINAKTLQNNRSFNSIVTKIVLQMNCKMGGSLWNVEVPMKNVMVVGYDAYHDSANKRQSVGAAVFSLNKEMSRWYSKAAMHTQSQQLMDNLAVFMTNALRVYQDQNNTLPSKLIFYRDGVGDGQLPTVREHEIPQLNNAFANVAPDYKPELIFIVVNKRVNVRFFREEAGGNGLINPPPGTVVDSHVTLPERYDFYMVPQLCNTGAVSPVSFNVLYDTSGLDPDKVHTFTYRMCHMYPNWQGCIRVPAPCQLAHKLAFLIGQSLHQSAHEDLSDKLYFL